MARKKRDLAEPLVSDTGNTIREKDAKRRKNGKNGKVDGADSGFENEYLNAWKTTQASWPQDMTCVFSSKLSEVKYSP